MLNIRPAYRTSIGTCARAWWCRISMHLATAYVQDSLRQSKISNNWTSKIVYKDIGLKRQRGYTTLNWENLRPKTRKRDILLWDHHDNTSCRASMQPLRLYSVSKELFSRRSSAIKVGSYKLDGISVRVCFQVICRRPVVHPRRHEVWYTWALPVTNTYEWQNIRMS